MINVTILPTKVHRVVYTDFHHGALKGRNGAVRFSARSSSWAKAWRKRESVTIGHDEVERGGGLREERVQRVVIVVISPNSECPTDGCQGAIVSHYGYRAAR